MVWYWYRIKSMVGLSGSGQLSMFHVDKYPMDRKKLSILRGDSFFWKKLTLEGSIAFSASDDFAKTSPTSPTRYTFYIRWLADAKGGKKKFIVRTGLKNYYARGGRREPRRRTDICPLGIHTGSSVMCHRVSIRVPIVSDKFASTCRTTGWLDDALHAFMRGFSRRWLGIVQFHKMMCSWNKNNNKI